MTKKLLDRVLCVVLEAATPILSDNLLTIFLFIMISYIISVIERQQFFLKNIVGKRIIGYTVYRPMQPCRSRVAGIKQLTSKWTDSNMKLGPLFVFNAGQLQ